MSTLLSSPGKVIAFYSYKGGTGRSMALANVACVLAQSEPAGGRVLVVDWDLEAPGLHRYLQRYLRRALAGDEEVQANHPGLIDLFLQIRSLLDAGGIVNCYDQDAITELLEQVPLEDYIIETDIANLSFLKAGMFDREYAAKVSTFNWPNLYERAPSLIRAFAERLSKDFRYVLIDSRTGLTDTSGICTMLMPEIIVAVFTPNRQSLAGVIEVVEQAGSYRSESDDLRPLLVFPLPSRIESSEPDLRTQWRFGQGKAGIEGFQPTFEKAFCRMYGLPICDLGPYFDDVQIQHVPRYAYGEEIAVLGEKSRDRLSLTRSYERFAARLVAAVEPWDEGDAESLGKEAIASLAIDEERQQRIKAAPYLQRLVDEIDSYQRMARFNRRVYSFAALTTVVVAAAVPVAITFADIAAGAWQVGLASAGLSVALLQVFLIVYRIPQLATGYREVAASIEREMLAFHQKVAPYDTEDAVERLINQTELLLRVHSLSPQTVLGRIRIYLSYRRVDASSHASRLYDSLSARFGAENVVMDQDILPGTDFVRAIERALRAADVFIVIIGPQWLASGDGRRRYGGASDFVRLELAMAFSHGLTVLPVLVGGAQLPSAEDLPEEIRSLARIQALELRNTHWKVDEARLIHDIERIAGWLAGPAKRHYA